MSENDAQNSDNFDYSKLFGKGQKKFDSVGRANAAVFNNKTFQSVQESLDDTKKLLEKVK